MVLPAVRGWRCLLVKDAGALSSAHLQCASGCPAGYGVGREPSEHRGPGPAVEPVRARAEDLDVGTDVRDGGVPARHIEGEWSLPIRAGEYVEENENLELRDARVAGRSLFSCESFAARRLDEASLEEINRKVLARVFWEDRAFFSSTLLHGTFSLRMCILNHNTSWGRREGDARDHGTVRVGSLEELAARSL